MCRLNVPYSTKPCRTGSPFTAAVLLVVVLTACTAAAPATAPAPTHPPLDPTYEAMIRAQRSPEVPELPFPDNPDPSACGIPVVWGDDGPAWLTGEYEGALIQPEVFLYESHLRLDVSARAPHGAEVQVLLYQQNPVTDYYLVKVKGQQAPNEGWIPAPLLSFEPVSP